MRKMKKGCSVLMCGTMVAGLMVGSVNAKETVTWWSWSTEATTALNAQAEYAEANADLDVELELTSSADYWVKLPVAIAAGTGPDVYQMTRPDFESYAAAGNAMDLTEVIVNSPLLQEYLDSLDPVLVETYQFEGKQMGIPLTIECSAIVYNKTIMEAAGIDLEAIEDTWTWADLQEIAEQLTVKDEKGETTQYGFYVPADRLPTWEIIWTSGYDIFDETGENCLLDDPGIAEALQPLADMYQSGVSPSIDVTTISSGDDMFMSGKIAMIAAGVWKVPTYSRITGFEWDSVELPVNPETGERYCSSNVCGLIINPKTENLDAAVALMEQLVQPESQKLYADSNSAIPALEEVREGYFDTEVADRIEAFEDALDYVHPNVLSQYIPYQQFSQLYADGLKQGITGEKTMAEALQDLDASITAVVEENKAG